MPTDGNRLRELGPARDVDKAREAIAKEMNKPRGTPQGREAQFQKAQLESEHRHGTNKGIKVTMQDKVR
ncbi:MAG TPA: hypothetical protein GXX51_12260 [Firmicutes bacterium]|nr:hypothetical protein [Bacillota bacterium]